MRVVVEKLFAGADELHLVFGGAVMQKGASPLLIDSLVQELGGLELSLHPRVLEVPPVAGALLFALDDGGVPGEEVRRRLFLGLEASD